MYDKNSHKYLVEAAITAGLGAGIVTTFAVCQGQSPLVGMAITCFAVLVALVGDRVGIF